MAWKAVRDHPMASAGRKLGWAALGLFITYMLATACSTGEADGAAGCEALNALGLEIASYQELLVWPGITAAPLREATEELEAAVLPLANVPGAEDYATDIIEALGPIGEAVDNTIPPSLAELRPGEPAQMAAAFIAVELQPLIDAHMRAIDEHC